MKDFFSKARGSTILLMSLLIAIFINVPEVKALNCPATAAENTQVLHEDPGRNEVTLATNTSDPLPVIISAAAEIPVAMPFREGRLQNYQSKWYLNFSRVWPIHPVISNKQLNRRLMFCNNNSLPTLLPA